MTEGRLEVESKSQECLVIIKREVTSNNLPKRRVLSSTHGVVGGRRLVTASYPIFVEKGQKFTHMGREKKNAVRYNMDEHRITAPF